MVAEKRDRILQAVMSVLERDYAGAPEKAPLNETKQWLTAFGEAWKGNRLDNELFACYLTQYLATLHDPNLSLLVSAECPYQPERCGFSVRRYGDELYVVEVREDERFTVGDAIVLLNRSKPDDHLRYAIGNPVNGDDPDRQLWDDLVSRCAHVLVRHADGSEEDVRMRRFPHGHAAAGAASAAAETADPVRVQDDVTIIDLRRAPAVFDDATYERILTALFAGRVNVGEVLGDEVQYTNYTVGNCAVRRAQLMAVRASLDPADAGWVDEELERLASHEGTGFVREVEREDYEVQGENPGRPVRLLTDVTTGAAGERIVRIAQAARSKGLVDMRVVGRATSGAIDYANPLAVSFDEYYTLVYPMGKTEAAFRGEGVSGTGIAPDTLVPFTPEECVSDEVQRRALER